MKGSNKNICFSIIFNNPISLYKINNTRTLPDDDFYRLSLECFQEKCTQCNFPVFNHVALHSKFSEILPIPVRIYQNRSWQLADPAAIKMLTLSRRLWKQWRLMKRVSQYRLIRRSGNRWDLEKQKIRIGSDRLD